MDFHYLLKLTLVRLIIKMVDIKLGGTYMLVFSVLCTDNISQIMIRARFLSFNGHNNSGQRTEHNKVYDCSYVNLDLQNLYRHIYIYLFIYLELW